MMFDPSTRVLAGDRPTGRLHLGHFIGSLRERVRLQHNHEVLVLVADLHALTTLHKRDDIDRIASFIPDQVLDYLSVGIAPERCCIYLQSAIPEVCELAVLLTNLVPLSRLQRIPSLKEMARQAQHMTQGMSMGLLDYPVLQAADILLARAHQVPVGADNLPHIELARELARRFNTLYGEVFVEPKAIVPG